MNIKRLTGTLGARVDGVDLSAPDVPWDALRGAMLRHRVLFFRGQSLAPPAQVAVARQFGAPTPAHPLVPGHADAPEVLVLDSAAYELGVGERGEGTSYNNKWHTDVTFSATPPAGTLLHAILVPEYGGDTSWADLAAAYRALSAPIRALIDGLTAEHDARKAFARPVNESADARRERLDRNPPVAHPVVRVHPETGERGLFVNPTFTTRVLGVSDAESRAILDLLCGWIANPDWTVRWRWQPGDVALWDNRVTAHHAAADYGAERRIMHRVTLAGDRPYGAAEA